jgi:hypothetical protein
MHMQMGKLHSVTAYQVSLAAVGCKGPNFVFLAPQPYTLSHFGTARVRDTIRRRNKHDTEHHPIDYDSALVLQPVAPSALPTA